MDNDYLAQGLQRGWGMAFGQLIEWKQEERVVIRAHLFALKKRLQRIGNEPLDYAHRFADWIDTTLGTGQFKRQQGVVQLNRLAQACDAKKRATDFVRQVCLRHLKGIDNGNIVIDNRYAVTLGYVETVYVSDYEARIKQGRVQYESTLSHEVLSRRLEQIYPQIALGISDFARQLTQHADVAKLRLTPQRKGFDDHYLTGEDIRL